MRARSLFVRGTAALGPIAFPLGTGNHISRATGTGRDQPAVGARSGERTQFGTARSLFGCGTAASVFTNEKQNGFAVTR